MDDSVKTLLGSVYTWITLYFTLRMLNPGRSAEWHCRLMTIIHAVLVSFLAVWCGLVQGPWPFTDAGGPNTPLQAFTIAICLGYFLFDMTWCLWYQTEGMVMLLHHGLSIVGMSVCLFLGNYGTELVATICGSELTNPLLQLRWFLRETGNYETIAGEIVDHLFMISFGILRIGVGSWLLYSYFKQPTDILGRVGGSVMYSISWLFWISIMKYAVKKYMRKWKAWKLAKVEKSKVDNKERTESDDVIVNKAKTDDVIKNEDSSTFNKGSEDSGENGQCDIKQDTLESSSDINNGKLRENITLVTSKECSNMNGTENKFKTTCIKENGCVENIICNGSISHDGIQHQSKAGFCDKYTVKNGFVKHTVDKKND